MSVHVFFDSLYYFFFSTYNFAVSPSGSTPIESVIMMLLASLTLFYTRAICCRESSLIRSCNRRQIHIVLIGSGGVNYICRIIVCSIWRSLLSCAGSQNCQRTYRQNNQFLFHTFLLSSIVSRLNGTLVLCHNYLTQIGH